jgi:hypothetical protein
MDLVSTGMHSLSSMLASLVWLLSDNLENFSADVQRNGLAMAVTVKSLDGPTRELMVRILTLQVREVRLFSANSP